MKLVGTLIVRDDADVIAAHLAFHRRVGVDVVLVEDGGADEATTEILEPYVRDGFVRRVALDTAPGPGMRRELSRLAASEHGADWVLAGEPDEFWWPRASSIKDVLEVVPARYTVVQALARVFRPAPGEGPFWERMTTRTSLLDPAAVPEAIGRALRPLLRGVAAASAFDHAIPLRAWYPVELLRFPLRSPEQMGRRRVPREPSSRLEDHAAELARAGLLAERWGELERERDGEADRFTVDERLRDVLRAAGDVGPAAPTVVEDASYAVECAAVGEADLDRIGLHIRELEERIARLERRPLERVKQRLRRSLPRHR